jgi:hypothetical protein
MTALLHVKNPLSFTGRRPFSQAKKIHPGLDVRRDGNGKLPIGF